MKQKNNFIEKVLQRLNKIDQTTVESYMLDLVKEKEFAFAVLESLPQGVLLINRRQIVTFSNSSAQNILMRSSSEVNPYLKDIIEDEELLRIITQFLTSSQRMVNVIVDIMKPKPMRLKVSFMPIYSVDNDDLKFFVVVFDELISDKEIEYMRRNETIESITKLAAGIAHEIGNPLNTIHIYLDLIMRSIKQKKIDNLAEWVSIINDETKRLDKMVKNFLDVTRNRIGLFRKRNINQSIRNAVHFLEPEIQKHHIAISLVLNNLIPEFFFDEDKMYEVFLNIIKNSIEAMPHGGTIKISTMKKGNIITIIAEDNGIGIREDDLPHIFDAYYTSKKHGSGLGLMNVYNIIRSHNGRIQVQSKPGEGTVVIISLPFIHQKLQLPYLQTSTSSSNS